MNSSNPRQAFFGPVSTAISDSALQIRVKPIPFLLIWFCFSLAPQIIFGFAFQNLLGSAMDITLKVMNSGGDPGVLHAEEIGILTRATWVISGIYLFLFFIFLYQGAVLAALVDRFRTMVVPGFVAALRDAVGLFPQYLSAVIVSGLRILVFSIFGIFAGLVLGMLTGDPISMVIMAAGLLSIIGFHFYGLAPFIHLATGATGKDSTKISRFYYRSNRPTVSALFLTVILFPVLVVSLLSNLISSAGFVAASVVLVSLLRSVALYGAIVVYINFAKNTFFKTSEKTLDGSEASGEENPPVQDSDNR